MDPGIFIIAAIIVLFIAIAVASIRHSIRERTKKFEELKTLSLGPIPEPPEEVTELLTSLHRWAGRKDLRVRDLFERRGEGYVLYLYDMIDCTGDGVTSIVTGGVAVSSDRLTLPEFRIIHRIEGQGGFTGLMKTIADKLISMAGAPLDFSMFPSFHQRYHVLGSDEKAIRLCLKESVLAAIGEKSMCTIEARGNAFAYNRLQNYDFAQKKKIEVTAKDRLQEALAIYRVLTEKEEEAI